MDYQAILKQFEHLNHMNPDKFEVEDLDLLMRGVEDRSGVPTLQLDQLFYVLLCLW